MSRIDGSPQPIRHVEQPKLAPPKPKAEAEPGQHRLVNVTDSFQRSRSLGQYSKSTGGEVVPVELKGQRELAGGEFSRDLSLYRAEGSWGTPGSSHYAAGSVAFGGVEAHGGGAITGNFRNLTFGAHGNVGASVYAVNAQGEFSSNYGIGSTNATGYAQVGASAEATADVAVDPLHGNLSADVEAGAFAGARAGGDIQETIGPATAEVGADVEAGIGAHFDADAGFHHGKFSAKFDVGACLGIGADLKFSVSIDFPKLASEAASLAKGAVHGLSTAAHAVGHAASSVGHAIGHAASSVGHAIGSVFKGW